MQIMKYQLKSVGNHGKHIEMHNKSTKHRLIVRASLPEWFPYGFPFSFIMFFLCFPYVFPVGSCCIPIVFLMFASCFARVRCPIAFLYLPMVALNKCIYIYI